MANTIRAAKNTFNGGLVMDLAPDTTPNEVLTSALNATLLTFNGNEMLLQNDMGNGRVETARLPEGYIPVGTCEFGDIIYIVSYNPLTNKSQIGCFPSPERNISSEETGGTGQELTAADFQQLDGSGNATGELVANSVKKILYNNKLNPGDKFIIYDKNDSILGERFISDIGNISHIYGSFPKLLKIHVIAIEDSGKITFLDSSLRWYTDDANNLDYFIRSSKTDGTTKKPDIDSYRNKLSSGFSVFLSKISGKLALLIELEKINGFSCTHSIYSKKGKSEEIPATEETHDFTKYQTYINFNWETEDNNTNPYALVITDYGWQGKDIEHSGQYRFWNYTHGKWELNNSNWEDGKVSTIITDLTIENNKLYKVDQLRPIDFNNANSNYASDYNTYLRDEEYSAVLLKFIEQIWNLNHQEYSGDVLSKLNIVRDFERDASNNIVAEGYISIPTIGKYYINAVMKEVTKLGENLITTYFSKSTKDGKLFEIEPIEIKDYIVNNYFHYPVYKKFIEFEIPTSQTATFKLGTEITAKISNTPDISNMIFYYDITPAMPYGLLREYTIRNYIDFGKIGSGIINLNTWKYFIGENLLTFTLGLETYEEENMGIAEVVLEFYDNQSQPAAVYHIKDKASYSGQFTETIPLNGVSNKSVLNNVNGNNIYHHCGAELNEYLEGSCTFAVGDDDGITKTVLATDTSEKWYIDDCGTLYQGMLYLVKIIIKYCPKDSLDNLDDTNDSRFVIFNRWMWTTTMYNDYYYNIRDFNDLEFILTLDSTPVYSLTPDYYYGQFNYNSGSTLLVPATELYKNISSKVQVVTSSDLVKIKDGEDPNVNPNEPEEPQEPGDIDDGIAPVWGYWQVTVNSDNKTIISISCDISHLDVDLSKLHMKYYDGSTYHDLYYGQYYRYDPFPIPDNTNTITIELDNNATEIDNKFIYLETDSGWARARKGSTWYSAPSRSVNFLYNVRN